MSNPKSPESRALSIIVWTIVWLILAAFVPALNSVDMGLAAGILSLLLIAALIFGIYKFIVWVLRVTRR